MLRLGKVHISPWFFVMPAAMLLLDRTIPMLLLLASVASHELAHLAALRLCGGRTEKIVLLAFRIRIDLAERPVLSYRDELLVASAGPTVNLLYAGGALLLCALAGPAPYAVFFCVSNLMLCVLNLLPVEMLDGGRILKAALCLRTEPDKADNIVGVISFLCLPVLLVCGALLFIRTGYNISLGFLTLWLAGSLIANARHAVS